MIKKKPSQVPFLEAQCSDAHESKRNYKHVNEKSQAQWGYLNGLPQWARFSEQEPHFSQSLLETQRKRGWSYHNNIMASSST